jgi:hypothetical protein
LRRRAGTAAAAVEVRCGSCRTAFTLSARNEYEWRRKGLAPVCSECRRPAVTLTDAERDRYFAWWRARFTDDELRELGSEF